MSFETAGTPPRPDLVAVVLRGVPHRDVPKADRGERLRLALAASDALIRDHGDDDRAVDAVAFLHLKTGHYRRCLRLLGEPLSRRSGSEAVTSAALRCLRSHLVQMPAYLSIVSVVAALLFALGNVSGVAHDLARAVPWLVLGTAVLIIFLALRAAGPRRFELLLLLLRRLRPWGDLGLLAAVMGFFLLNVATAVCACGPTVLLALAAAALGITSMWLLMRVDPGLHTVQLPGDFASTVHHLSQRPNDPGQAVAGETVTGVFFREGLLEVHMGDVVLTGMTTPFGMIGCQGVGPASLVSLIGCVVDVLTVVPGEYVALDAGESRLAFPIGGPSVKGPESVQLFVPARHELGVERGLWIW